MIFTKKILISSIPFKIYKIKNSFKNINEFQDHKSIKMLKINLTMSEEKFTN
jgi:hypothetical protein